MTDAVESQACPCSATVGVVIHGERVEVYDEEQSCDRCNREAINNLREQVADLTVRVESLESDFLRLIRVVGQSFDIVGDAVKRLSSEEREQGW